MSFHLTNSTGEHTIRHNDATADLDTLIPPIGLGYVHLVVPFWDPVYEKSAPVAICRDLAGTLNASG